MNYVTTHWPPEGNSIHFGDVDDCQKVDCVEVRKAREAMIVLGEN